MSDTYFIKNLRCAYCGENNDFEKDVMKYGHLGLSCTFEFREEFVCDKCNEKNEIVMSFVVVKSKSQRELHKITEKDFDKWNEIKKGVDARGDSGPLFPKEQWVWMCSFGVNVGYEQDGAGESFERPVLVVKKFNNKMFWVAPLSTKQKDFDFYYNFTDKNGNKVSVILAQLRLMSVKRFIRDMYVMEDNDFANITARLKRFLEKSEPRTRRGSSRPEGTL